MSNDAMLLDVPARRAGRTLALLALALGTFCIGTTEFASMGIIQLFSAGLGVDIPQQRTPSRPMRSVSLLALRH